MGKTLQPVFFICALFIFSISLPKIFLFVYGNVNPKDDLTVKTKKTVIHTTNYFLFTIDAQDKENWVYFSFSDRKTYSMDDHLKLSWDIAFKRANVISNGGETNEQGRVGIINMGPIELNSITVAPEAGYVNDSTTWGLNRNKALNKWYRYKTKNHKLESKLDVYIIKTVDNKYVKMRILDYYCSDGEPACITIEYFLQPDATRNLKNNNTVSTRVMLSELN